MGQFFGMEHPPWFLGQGERRQGQKVSRKNGAVIGGRICNSGYPLRSELNAVETEIPYKVEKLRGATGIG